MLGAFSTDTYLLFPVDCRRVQIGLDIVQQITVYLLAMAVMTLFTARCQTRSADARSFSAGWHYMLPRR
jgi:hypothetical protein